MIPVCGPQTGYGDPGDGTMEASEDVEDPDAAGDLTTRDGDSDDWIPHDAEDDDEPFARR